MGEEKPIDQMTVEEAKGEIDRRLEDFESDYWVNERPGHQRAVDEMRRLHEVAWPSRGEDLTGNRGLAQRLEEEGITSVEDIEKIAAEKADEDEEEDVPLTEAQEEGFKKLKGEWGNEFDAHLDEARSIYQGVIQTYGKDNPEFEQLMESSLGNEPSVIKLFHEIGKQEREMGIFNCPHCGESITPDEEE